MNFNKRVNGSWVDTPHYIHNTSTDTITTLPAVIYANDTTATVGLKGNMEQNGTPSPDNPIMPEGTGERTGNLFYKTITNTSINSSGKVVSNDSFKLLLAKITQGVTYSMVETYYAIYESEPNIDSTAYNGRLFGNTFTAPIDGYVAVRYQTNDSNEMINTGSTPLPYEPYGYKIPISSASTTTPVYLGEVETTRRVKKYEITGQENWELHPTLANLFRLLNFDGYLFELKNILVCNTYKSVVNGGAADFGDKQTGFYFSSGAVSRILYIRDSSYSTVTDFKAYLAQQYANGTPVTIWYVLATPETGIVNEPLRKIGNYADTVSGITIPTIAGANTLSVDTTLQPSEVTATYKGWHNASVKEKSANYLDENDFGLVEVAAGVYRTGTDAGVLPSGTYTLSANKSSSAVQIYRTTKNGSTYNYETISELPYTFTADGVSNQIFRTAGITETSWADAGYSKVMLNAGETAQTYESYWK